MRRLGSLKVNAMPQDTDSLDAVLERVHKWPAARQEDARLVLLAMEAGELGTYVLSDEERADIELALEEVTRGEFASDEEVTATFDRYRR
jgi:hypothetical protein